MTMECNKEEAIRAKDITENRMWDKDFVKARKIIIKAQQLFPDLGNISQMLTVCDVHSCAEIKVNGETDWYGILQVEETAGKTTIKKQYRKPALLLHPDKNKFEGAEAAFKLVGEASRTLSDQTRRSLLHIKRQTVFTTVQARQPPQQPGLLLPESSLGLLLMLHLLHRLISHNQYKIQMLQLLEQPVLATPQQETRDPDECCCRRCLMFFFFYAFCLGSWCRFEFMILLKHS